MQVDSHTWCMVYVHRLSAARLTHANSSDTDFLFVCSCCVVRRRCLESACPHGLRVLCGACEQKRVLVNSRVSTHSTQCVCEIIRLGAPECVCFARALETRVCGLINFLFTWAALRTTRHFLIANPRREALMMDDGRTKLQGEHFAAPADTDAIQHLSWADRWQRVDY